MDSVSSPTSASFRSRSCKRKKHIDCSSTSSSSQRRNTQREESYAIVLLVLAGMHCKDSIPKLRNKFSQKARPQSQIPHSLVCERFIYSQDRSAYNTLLQENMWTNSLTETWMLKLVLRVRNSFSGNTLMGFSLQCGVVGVLLETGWGKLSFLPCTPPPCCGSRLSWAEHSCLRQLHRQNLPSPYQ